MKRFRNNAIKLETFQLTRGIVARNSALAAALKSKMSTVEKFFEANLKFQIARRTGKVRKLKHNDDWNEDIFSLCLSFVIQHSRVTRLYQ